MQQHLPAETELPMAVPQKVQSHEEVGHETETAADTIAFERVSQLLANAQYKNQIRTTQSELMLLVFGVGGMLLMFVVSLGLSSGSEAHFWAIFIVLVVLNALVVLVVATLRPVAYDIDALVKSSGIQAVGPLMDALQSNVSTKDQRVIYAALTHLLPQMKASDAGLLTAKQRAALYRLLRWNVLCPWYRWHEDFKIAALRALGQIGDAAAIPIVERYAKMKGRDERDGRVREAAQEALPLLRIHAGEVTSTRTLLRPAGQEEVAPQTLLRAATQGTQTPAEQLVRPAE